MHMFSVPAANPNHEFHPDSKRLLFSCSPCRRGGNQGTNPVGLIRSSVSLVLTVRKYCCPVRQYPNLELRFHLIIGCQTAIFYQPFDRHRSRKTLSRPLHCISDPMLKLWNCKTRPMLPRRYVIGRTLLNPETTSPGNSNLWSSLQ